MRVNFKGCTFHVYAQDKKQAAGDKRPTAEPAGVISTQRTYTLAGFLANRDAVHIGDRVRLPAFTVPAAKMDGEEVLQFEEVTIADEAIVIGGSADRSRLDLLFSHCLFPSAMDLNGETEFPRTQLAQYLESEFKRAMNNAGIPAEYCGLVSRDEMFGGDRLPWFRDGRNHVAFDIDDDCARWYWLSTPHEASASHWCYADNNGHANYHAAGRAGSYVRPRFVIGA